MVNDAEIQLQEIAKKNVKHLYIDFLHGKLAHRRKYGGGKGQLIARAVGVKAGVTLTVVDATAGLGQDGFVLACLGCKVHLLERSPIIAALLEDGLKRAKADSSFSELKIKLTVADAITFLPKMKKKPDVIYLDPMYPERAKSALGKKELRILGEIVGKDLDAAQLLKVALKNAKKRVVVKRPRLAKAITGPKPDLVFKGKSSRYDVYICSH